MALFLISISLFIIGLTSLLVRHKAKKKGVKNKYNSLNRYIRHHKQYLNDEIQYKEYLKWCIENGEIAMDSKGFEDIRTKDKSLKELLENDI